MTVSQRLCLGLLLPVLLAGCGVTGTEEFAVLQMFDLIPALETIDVSGVNPAHSSEIWELRDSFFSEFHTVVLSGGTVGREELDEELLVRFDLDYR